MFIPFPFNSRLFQGFPQNSVCISHLTRSICTVQFMRLYLNAVNQIKREALRYALFFFSMMCSASQVTVFSSAQVFSEFKPHLIHLWGNFDVLLVFPNMNQYIKNTVGLQGLSTKMHSLKLQCASLQHLFVISNGVQCARKGAYTYMGGRRVYEFIAPPGMLLMTWKMFSLLLFEQKEKFYNGDTSIHVRSITELRICNSLLIIFEVNQTVPWRSSHEANFQNCPQD